MNRKGYYNSDGVSDVIGALLSEIRDRIRIKYNSSDAMALTQRESWNGHYYSRSYYEER